MKFSNYILILIDLNILIVLSAIFSIYSSTAMAQNCLIPSLNGQYVWTKTSAPNYVWSSIACDSNCELLAAGVKGGGIFTSNNYGADWTQTSAPELTWATITSSSNGQYLAAGASDDFPDCNPLFTSNNFGISWVNQSNCCLDWMSVSSSSSGQYLAGAGDAWPGGVIEGYYTYLVASQDYGETCEYISLEDGYDAYTTMDESGQFVGVATTSPSGILTSDNYGIAFNQSFASTASPWTAIASSGDAQYFAATTSYLSIFMSNNSGKNWYQTTAPYESWSSIAISSSGQFLAAATSYGLIYVSYDNGTTWILTTAPSLSWTSLAISSQGDVIFAASSDGGIYTGCFLFTPTSQPTTQPSTRPSSQPTIQPSTIPSSQPSAWPSSSPTSIPSSVPTLSTGTILYENAVSNVNSDGFLQSTTFVEQLGAAQDENIYLSVEFLETGFGEGSFTVSVSVNGYEVCSDCSVNDLCGTNYISCCNNEQINALVSDADGGSVTIVAISNTPYNAELCDTTPYFSVSYGISIGNAFPTTKPTQQPASSVSSTKTTTIYALNVGNVVIINVVCIAAISIFGIMVYYIRKENKKLHPLGIYFTVINLVLFVGTFVAQLLFASVLFDSQFNLAYGYSWVCFRGAFVLISFIVATWVVMSGKYSTYMNWEFMSKNKKMYGIFFFLMLFQPMLLQFLPWHKSKITDYTLGFPTYFLYYLCTFLTVMESFILTLIFALFAIEEQDLFSEAAEQQLVFFLSIFFTFFLGTATAVESLFVGKAQKQESENRSVSKNDQMEMPDIPFEVENPISHESTNDHDISLLKIELKNTQTELQKTQMEVKELKKIVLQLSSRI